MNLLLLCIHLILWSGYSFVEYLSNRDKLSSKVILFVVFGYVAYLIAERLIERKRTALFVTILILGSFFGCQKILWMVF
ncbi:hypothetical protein [Priestia koreensis]|uniref:Uncharacterized protein n=2 Tax=Priestia koreensis TaxID=284581 RepID=A0A0M0LIP6_9BACI|nr:hypothetical protein [Priestia koreensis]KOO50929.1 hypothetical protein AMD01_02245 [Priestia koreensis]MCM3003165.1 hypothetical protein [Priestia koreensis]UNL85970.1 hypothetical protein IE339_05550 [Priestia koreensis]